MLSDLAISAMPGIPLRWPKGDFFSTYPFQRHGYGISSLGYKFCYVQQNGVEFGVRSETCSGSSTTGGGPCEECEAATDKVERLAQLAEHASAHTNHKYLTHQQLHELLRYNHDTMSRLKLKVRVLSIWAATIMLTQGHGCRL